MRPRAPASARSRAPCIGAATGDNSKERRERALIGAGVGALTGAGVGAYMDKQEAKLRAQLQGTGVSVTRSGNDLILNMPGNITFKTASADLNAGFYKVLDSVVAGAQGIRQDADRRRRPHGQRRRRQLQPATCRCSAPARWAATCSRMA